MTLDGVLGVVKMTTNQGLVGYSEITDSNGSPHGMAGVVRDLTPLLLGRDRGMAQALRKCTWRPVKALEGLFIRLFRMR